MAGGYITVVLVNRMGLPFLASLPLAFLFTAVLGAVFERTLYVHVYSRSHLDQVLFTIGLVFMSVAAVDYVMGSQQVFIQIPSVLQGRFEIFGIGAFAGRTLMATDDIAGAPPVAVMSYHTWQEHFGLDPAVIGATFTINQVAYTVVGIAPPGFFGDTLRSDPPDFWGSPIEGARSLGPHNNEPVASSRARMALSDGAAQARNQSRADSVAANG